MRETLWFQVASPRDGLQVLQDILDLHWGLAMLNLHHPSPEATGVASNVTMYLEEQEFAMSPLTSTCDGPFDEQLQVFGGSKLPAKVIMYLMWSRREPLLPPRMMSNLVSGLLEQGYTGVLVLRWFPQSNSDSGIPGDVTLRVETQRSAIIVSWGDSKDTEETQKEEERMPPIVEHLRGLGLPEIVGEALQAPLTT